MHDNGQCKLIFALPPIQLLTLARFRLNLYRRLHPLTKQKHCILSRTPVARSPSLLTLPTLRLKKRILLGQALSTRNIRQLLALPTRCALGTDPTRKNVLLTPATPSVIRCVLSILPVVKKIGLPCFLGERHRTSLSASPAFGIPIKVTEILLLVVLPINLLVPKKFLPS